MLFREQALQRYLTESPCCGAAEDALRAALEDAFRAGWTAAGGDRLLIDAIPMEEEQ
ncbi:MAG: hypothetical protein Q4C72_01485 [Eubacteriales bacterium]|nr:hypothetical protein [Eubacteriales bacterium]